MTWNVTGVAIAHGCGPEYVERRLKEEPELLALTTGVIPCLVFTFLKAKAATPDITRILFNYGADSNENFARTTPWQYIMAHMLKEQWVLLETDVSCCSNTIEILSQSTEIWLQNDADKAAVGQIMAVYNETIRADPG